MEPLILVPGLGSDRTVWQRTIDALGVDAACVVADTFSDDTLAGMAARILASAPPAFSLAGVSMGGMVALEVMRRAQGRVRRLALFDTTAAPDTDARLRSRRITMAAVRLGAAFGVYRILAAASLRSLVHPDAPGDVRAAIVEMSDRVGPDAYLRQTRAVMRRDDQRPILATIAVPTLVVVGADDTMTPRACSDEIARAIPGAALHVVPDCGHLPPIEKPAISAGLLREWLARE